MSLLAHEQVSAPTDETHTVVSSALSLCFDSHRVSRSMFCSCTCRTHSATRHASPTPAPPSQHCRTHAASTHARCLAAVGAADAGTCTLVSQLRSSLAAAATTAASHRGAPSSCCSAASPAVCGTPCTVAMSCPHCTTPGGAAAGPPGCCSSLRRRPTASGHQAAPCCWARCCSDGHAAPMSWSLGRGDDVRGLAGHSCGYSYCALCA